MKPLGIVAVVACLVLVGCGSHRGGSKPPPKLDYVDALYAGTGWINEDAARDGFQSEIRELAWREKYDELERLAAQFEQHPQYLYRGLTTMDEFVLAFQDETNYAPDDILRFRHNLEAWVLTHPHSQVAPLAAAAEALNNAFQTRADAAHTSAVYRLIEAAQQAAPQSPYPCQLKIALLDMCKGDPNLERQAFAEAIKRDKYCYPVWHAEMQYLLDTSAPRSEVLRLLTNAAASTRDKLGDTYYALLVWHFYSSLKPQFNDSDASWARTRQGFMDLGQRWPEAMSALTEFAVLAHRVGDDGLARALANRLGNCWDYTVWNQSQFDDFRQSLRQDQPTVSDDEVPFHPALIKRPMPISQFSHMRRVNELEYQINSLMLSANYAPIDELASLLRHKSDNFDGSLGGLGSLYVYYPPDERIWSDEARWPNARFQSMLDRLATWQRAVPDSEVARVGQAELLTHWAIRLAGLYPAERIGHATDESRRLASVKFSAARTLLEQAEKIEPDPELYLQLMTLARFQRWSASDEESLYRRASERFPFYWSLYRERIWQLMPAYGGTPGQAEAFAREVAQKTSKKWGMGLYSALADWLRADVGNDVFAKYGFSWRLVRQGIDDIVSGHNDGLLSAKGLASLAGLARSQNDGECEYKLLRAVPETELLEVEGNSVYGVQQTINAYAHGNMAPDSGPLTASPYDWGIYDVNSVAPRLQEKPDTIRLRDGVTFGVIAKLDRVSFKPHVVRYTVKHPPYKKPDGSVERESVVTENITLTSGIYLWRGLFSFVRSAPWEWVPGTYVCRIEIDGQKMMEKAFIVVPGETPPPVAYVSTPPVPTPSPAPTARHQPKPRFARCLLSRIERTTNGGWLSGCHRAAKAMDQYAALACLAGDKRTARGLFARLGDRVDDRYFDGGAARFKAWAMQ